MDKIRVLPVVKAKDEELKQVTFIAMLPDSVDLHGDFTSVDEVRKACHSFNSSAKRANLFHKVMSDSFEIVESYIAPTDFVLGDKTVVKGTWLVNLQVHDDDLWEMVKSGDVNGVSIGCVATVEELDE